MFRNSRTRKPRSRSGVSLAVWLIAFAGCSAPQVRYLIWDCEPGVSPENCRFRGETEALDLDPRSGNNLVCKTLDDELALLGYLKALGAPYEGLDHLFGVRAGEDLEAKP